MYDLTDTHCHLNNPRFAGRVEEVLARACTAGVCSIVVPGWDHESSVRALALSAAYPAIRPAVGLHPWFITQHPDLRWLETALDDRRVVALGEIGLDGAIDGANVAHQEEVFRIQLRWAAARNLPVLLHCRHAWDRMLACLHDQPDVRGVVHAYSGSWETLHACVRLGLYISFAGMVTRPNSRRAHEAAMLVPADRILLETDAPNMALDGIPAADSEPALLPRILEYVATLRGVAPETLAAQIAENTRILFGE